MQHHVLLNIKYTKYSKNNELDRGKGKQTERAVGKN